MSTTLASSFVTSYNFRFVLYIIAFSLFIYGLSGLTGPKTAVRGNRIAAVGTGIAVIATLLVDPLSNFGLILLGVVIGTAFGVPAARNVKMTQMPQMVALFNGVGGGAVALIAWVEFRTSGGFARTRIVMPQAATSAHRMPAPTQVRVFGTASPAKSTKIVVAPKANASRSPPLR